MAFPGDVNSLGSVSGSQTLAAAGHATRHNEVKTALEGLRDVLGGTAVPSGTVQPILAAGSASAPSLSFTGDSNTGLWSPAADTLAASTGGTERMRIDNAGLITGSGTSLGAWTSYTPTLGGTGWVIGDGTASGYYCQIGKTVHFQLLITFGSTSTYGGSALTITLPANRRTTLVPLFAGHATDTSAGIRYPLVARSGAAGTMTPISTSANAALTTTAPFTWASTDTIEISGTYEIA